MQTPAQEPVLNQTSIKTIYRIESAKGIGLYSYRKADEFAHGTLVDEHRHPTPSDDSLLVANVREYTCRNYFQIEDHMRFGFCSLEQLRSWIYQDEWLVKLHKYGLKIAEYRLYSENVCEGNTQAIFDGGEVLHKKQYSILEYFGLVENEETKSDQSTFNLKNLG